MSKTKRLLAMVLAVLMTLSVLSVMTFAAVPVFANDYVDGTGTIKKTALLVDPSLAGRTGDVTAKWDDVSYIFTMGENAFSSLAQAISKADLNMGGETSQILLAAGNYGNLLINMPLEIYGVGWNTDPNVKNPSDPTADWTRNSKWNTNTSNVDAVVIQAGAYKGVTVQGVKIQGHIYDIQRAVSTVPFALKFKNIIYSQTSAGITLTQTNSATRVTNTNYAMSFRNYNANNAAESGMYNKDTTHLINFRVENLENIRFIDEQVSPVFVFDGLYFDFTELADMGFWMKWMPYFNECEYAVKNSYLKSIPAKDTAFYHEGFTNGIVGDASKKIPVGEMLEGQTATLNITNSVFKNWVKTDEVMENGAPVQKTTRSFAVRLHSFTKINIDGNYIINETPNTRIFPYWSSTSSTTDYTDIVSYTNNMFIGQSELVFDYGISSSKADFTGNFISPVYDSDWVSLTGGILPTGKVKFDYCYLDAARKKKTNEVPDFSITDGVVSDADKTVSMNAAAGTVSITPTVNGLPGYAFYESDAEFSNLNDFKELTPIESLTLKNLTNNFLFVALSYDGNTQVPYKMTVNKTASATAVLSNLTNVSTGAAATKNGLEFNVRVERDYDNVSFGLDLSNGSTAALYKEGETRRLTADNGIYSLSGLELGETVVVRAEIKNGNDTEVYYINVRRDLSDDTSITFGDNVTVNGSKLSMSAGEDDTEVTFDVDVAVGAKVIAWKGTSVYTAKDGALTIKDLRSGDNVYTLAVVAEDGYTTTRYELTISKPLSREAKLISIKDADKIDDFFTATAVDSFAVNAKVSYGATYKVYADEDCTNVIADNKVAITGDTSVYIVVTAEDGVTKSAPYELYIVKEVDDEVVGSFTVEGGELVGGSIIEVALADNLTEATLKIKAENVTYKLYADIWCTVKATNKIKLDSARAVIYAVVTYEDNTEVMYMIGVTSERTPVKYADAKKIPTWAQPYVEVLNESGLGIIKGDDKGNFNANNNTTRYEIAAIATRILGIDASQFAGVKLTYKDKIAAWAENYVKAVTKLGIMGGTTDAKGKLVFDGQGNTTRAQLAKIMVEVSFGSLGVKFTEIYPTLKSDFEAAYKEYKFADNSKVQSWAKDYVTAAVALGLFNGRTENGKNYIDPNTNIKRSELATVVARMLVSED